MVFGKINSIERSFILLILKCSSIQNTKQFKFYMTGSIIHVLISTYICIVEYCVKGLKCVYIKSVDSAIVYYDFIVSYRLHFAIHCVDAMILLGLARIYAWLESRLYVFMCAGGILGY